MTLRGFEAETANWVETAKKNAVTCETKPQPKTAETAKNAKPVEIPTLGDTSGEDWLVNRRGIEALSDDFVLTGHVGLGIATGAPSISLGTEVGAGLAYMLTAGLGLYVQATQNVWFGSEMTIHPTLSGEGGIVIDYEMLP